MRVVSCWFWRRPAGLFVAEAHAAGDLAVDDLGRHRADFAGVLAAAVLHFGRHADREIVREHFGNLHFDFERAQIDDGQDRRVRRDVRALLHDQLADLAVDRRAHLEFVDLARDVLDEQLLPIERKALGLELEREAVALEQRCPARRS